MSTKTSVRYFELLKQNYKFLNFKSIYETGEILEEPTVSELTKEEISAPAQETVRIEQEVVA